jgi:anhydro-N-acetylmuramic acid kinase
MQVIGLMSGTSVDGIDVALTNISGQGYQIEAALLKGITHPYPAELRSHILALCANEPLSFAAMAELDDAIAHHFVQAIQALDVDLADVDLIGSHGQTLHHRPPQPNRLGHTLQLGRGDLIAHLTGCPTISNFRVADIALGGQGAPLVPIIDACLLSQPHQDLAVQNIGGIGNVTYLPPWDRRSKSDPQHRSQPETVPLANPSKPLVNTANPSANPSANEPTYRPPVGIKGWDTGPGNALIDWAVTTLSQGRQTYDDNGRWAAQGNANQALIEQWLNEDPFFQISPPKSTGREHFSTAYAERCWQTAQALQLTEADFIATLTDFTAASIELNYRQFLPQVPAEILVGGGGSRNQYLMARLQQRLPESKVVSTDERALNADYKEAIAFAILAYWRWHQVPGNLPSVTGASRACLLGEIWLP